MGYFVEGGGAVIGGVAVGGAEEGAGAGGGVAGGEGDGEGDGGGEGGVGGGAVGAAEVADVAAHEDEGCAGCAGEAGDVAYGVLMEGGLLVLIRCGDWEGGFWEGGRGAYAWNVEDVEAAVAEEVVVGEGADCFGGVEGDFVNGAAFEVGFEHGGVFSGWVAGHEGFFEAGADIEVGRLGE